MMVGPIRRRSCRPGRCSGWRRPASSRTRTRPARPPAPLPVRRRSYARVADHRASRASRRCTISESSAALGSTSPQRLSTASCAALTLLECIRRSLEFQRHVVAVPAVEGLVCADVSDVGISRQPHPHLVVRGVVQVRVVTAHLVLEGRAHHDFRGEDAVTRFPEAPLEPPVAWPYRLRAASCPAGGGFSPSRNSTA